MTREEAIERLNIHKSTSVFEDSMAKAIDMAIEALKADAVSLTGTMKYLTKPHNYCEVVRCEDCKWYKLTDNNDTEICTNKQWDISMAVYPIISADSFCSYGERSEK